MQPWTGFYTVTAGLSATLLGLLFVSVSLNATAILSETHRGSRLLAEQAFQNYVSVLTVSLLAIFPSLNLREFSYTVLCATGLSCIWALVRLYQAIFRHRGIASRRESVRRQIFSLLGFGILLFAAIRMAIYKGDDRNLLACAILILLLAATRVSWKILLQLAAAKNEGAG